MKKISKLELIFALLIILTLVISISLTHDMPENIQITAEGEFYNIK